MFVGAYFSVLRVVLLPEEWLPDDLLPEDWLRVTLGEAFSLGSSKPEFFIIFCSSSSVLELENLFDFWNDC